MSAELSIVRRSFSRNRQAAVAVEFAILSPIYIFLLMGMVAYGIYFGAAHSVQQIAADAARASIAGLDEADRRAIALRFIETNAGGYFFIDARNLALSVGDSAADGNQFQVVVDYDARDLPIWSLFRDFPLPEHTITRRSTIRIGGI